MYSFDIIHEFQLYYNEKEASKYANNSRIRLIQAQLADRAIDLLALPEDQNCLLLDIGCGSGLSGECISNRGHHWVGCDISPSMLDIAVKVIICFTKSLLEWCGWRRYAPRYGSGIALQNRHVRWSYQYFRSPVALLFKLQVGKPNVRPIHFFPYIQSPPQRRLYDSFQQPSFWSEVRFQTEWL